MNSVELLDIEMGRLETELAALKNRKRTAMEELLPSGFCSLPSHYDFSKAWYYLRGYQNQSLTDLRYHLTEYVIPFFKAWEEHRKISGGFTPQEKELNLHVGRCSQCRKQNRVWSAVDNLEY